MKPKASKFTYAAPKGFCWACHVVNSMPMQNQVELARYCHLPIGNMSGDWVLCTADAIFARCLRDAGHLLWITDPSLPDIAVRNNDTEAAEELLDKSQLTMEVCLNYAILGAKFP